MLECNEKQIKIPSRAVILVLFALLSTLTAAKNHAHYLIVSSHHQQLSDHLRQQLLLSRPGVTIQSQVLARTNWDPSAILVTVGLKATQEALRQDLTPSLATGLSETDRLTIESKFPHRAAWLTMQITAAPLQCQLELAVSMTSANQSIGIFLGPHSYHQRRFLDEFKFRNHRKLHIYRLQVGDKPADLLAHTRAKISILIALADGELYPENTLRALLLQAQMMQLPVVGFAREQLAAGASAVCAVGSIASAKNAINFLLNRHRQKSRPERSGTRPGHKLKAGNPHPGIDSAQQRLNVPAVIMKN